MSNDHRSHSPMTSNSPLRVLSTSISVPRDIDNDTQQQQPPSPNKRRPQHLNSPWCGVPSKLPPLTIPQQNIAHECTDTISTDNTPSIVALVGPRGRGKSTIAAHVVRSKTPTLWFHAHSESTLRASYMAILQTYAPHEKALGGQTTRQLADCIRQNMSLEDWQIVYDDVGVAPSVFFSQFAIPTATASPLFLLTTTLSDYHALPQDRFRSIFVETELDLEDAKAIMFSRECKEDDTTTIQEQETAALQTLLPLLHHIPMALCMARAQWHQLNVPFQKYVHLLQEFKDDYLQPDENLNWFAAFATEHVWNNQKRALMVLSVIHPDHIPLALLKPSEIAALLDWQVLQSQHAHSYSISRGLQQAIRRRSGVTDALSVAVETFETCLKEKSVDVIDLLPHLECLQTNLDLLGEESLPTDFPREAYANVLLQTGVALQRHPLADYARAIQCYHKALQVLGRNEASPVAKTLYYRLGTCARLQGDTPQAKVYSLHSLALYGYPDLESKVPGEPPTLVHNESNIQPGEWNVLSQLFHTCGHASWQEGQVLEARIYFEHELAVKRAWYGAEEVQDRVARTLNNLGSVCRDGGDLTAARDYSLQSLRMQQELGHDDSLETATTLNNLGSLSYSLCAYSQALDFLEQALAMKQKCYQQSTGGVGPVRNLDMGETYYNLGMLADHLSHYDQSQEYYKESLECKYAVFGKDAQNAQIATSLVSLGLSTMNHGHYKQAEEYYQQALEMQREFYRNQGNMEVVRTLHGLGILNYHLGKLQQSRKYHRQALEMQQEFEAKDRQNHPRNTFLSDPRTANLSQIMQNLGNLAHNLGEYDDARDYYEQGLKLYSQVSVDTGKDNHLQQMLSNLQNLSSASSYDAARTYYEKALEMKYFVYGDKAKNSDLAFSLRSLALLDDNAGKHKEAQECYEKALDMLHHFYGSQEATNAEIAGVLDGLGSVNFNLGNYEESKRWLQEGLAMKETVFGQNARNNEIATSHVSLGTLAHTMGNYDDARKHLESAFEMQLAVFGDSGEQNIELGVTANCLANLYRDLADNDKASALYDRAMGYTGQDSENPFRASVLTDFGEFHRQQGDYQKATACFHQAALLQAKLYGEDADSLDIARALMSHGKLHMDLGNYDESQRSLDRALQMQKRVLQGNEDDVTDSVASGEIADTLHALGELLFLRGDLEASKAHLENARAMRKSVYGDVKTLEMAQTVRSLERVYRELHEADNALLCKRELTALRNTSPLLSKVLDECSPGVSTASVHHNRRILVSEEHTQEVWDRASTNQGHCEQAQVARSEISHRPPSGGSAFCASEEEHASFDSTLNGPMEDDLVDGIKHCPPLVSVEQNVLSECQDTAQPIHITEITQQVREPCDEEVDQIKDVKGETMKNIEVGDSEWLAIEEGSKDADAVCDSQSTNHENGHGQEQTQLVASSTEGTAQTHDEALNDVTLKSDEDATTTHSEPVVDPMTPFEKHKDEAVEHTLSNLTIGQHDPLATNDELSMSQDEDAKDTAAPSQTTTSLTSDQKSQHDQSALEETESVAAVEKDEVAESSPPIPPDEQDHVPAVADYSKVTANNDAIDVEGKEAAEAGTPFEHCEKSLGDTSLRSDGEGAPEDDGQAAGNPEAMHENKISPEDKGRANGPEATHQGKVPPVDDDQAGIIETPHEEVRSPEDNGQAGDPESTHEGEDVPVDDDQAGNQEATHEDERLPKDNNEAGDPEATQEGKSIPVEDDLVGNQEATHGDKSPEDNNEAGDPEATAENDENSFSTDGREGCESATKSEKAARNAVVNNKKQKTIHEEKPPAMDWTDRKLVKRLSKANLMAKEAKKREQVGNASKPSLQERPMDWTDRKLVKRMSQAKLMSKEAKVKGEGKQAEQVASIGKPISQGRPMDWTDRKLVKKLSQAKLKAEASTSEHSSQGRPMDWTDKQLVKRRSKANMMAKESKENSAVNNHKSQEHSRSKTDPKSPTKDNKEAKKARKPTMEKRSESKAKMQVGGDKTMGNTKHPQQTDEVTARPKESSSAESKLDRSAGSHSSRKNEDLVRSEGENAGAPKMAPKDKQAKTGTHTSDDKLIRRTGETEKQPAEQTPDPPTEPSVEEVKAGKLVEQVRERHSEEPAAASKVQDRDDENVAFEKGEVADEGTAKEEKKPDVDDVSELAPRDVLAAESSQQPSGESSGEGYQGSGHDDADENEISEVAKSQKSSAGEEGRKKAEKNSESQQISRSTFSIEEDPSASFSKPKPLSARNVRGGVTDMPPREPEVVSTTCGCWPFSHRK